MPEGEHGVRCIPHTARGRARAVAQAPPGGIIPRPGNPLCVGCGRLIAGVNPCPHQLSAQDAMLLAAQKLGLNLEAEVPDDKAPSLWTP